MTEPTPTYTAVKRGNRMTYELTPAEAAVIEAIRRNTVNGRIWTLQVRYEPTTATLAMFELRPAGRIGK